MGDEACAGGSLVAVEVFHQASNWIKAAKLARRFCRYSDRACSNQAPHSIVVPSKPLESPCRQTSIARLHQHSYQRPNPLLLFSSIFEPPKISITAFRSNSPVNGSSQSLAIVSLKCCGAFRTLRHLEGDDGKCDSLIPVLSGLFYVIVNKGLPVLSVQLSPCPLKHRSRRRPRDRLHNGMRRRRRECRPTTLQNINRALAHPSLA